MKVSIITAVYNNPEIYDAIQSVQEQTYVDIEHIIIDGGSNDETKNIVGNTIRDSDIYVSEPDNGIYDALNKGISLATGDIIGFLHSDDFFSGEEIISEILKCFKDKSVDGIYGDLNYVGKENTSHVIRRWKSRQYNRSDITKGWMLPHPTLFLKRDVYKSIGYFDLSFQIASDYDYILRVLKSEYNIKYYPRLITNMRVGGESNKSLERIMQKWREGYTVLNKYVVFPFFPLLGKNFSKLTQFITKKGRR